MEQYGLFIVLGILALAVLAKAFDAFLDWREPSKKRSAPVPLNPEFEPRSSPLSSESTELAFLTREREQAIREGQRKLSEIKAMRQQATREALNKLVNMPEKSISSGDSKIITLPDDSDNMRSLILKFLRDRVIFKRRDASSDNVSYLSFFGGLPIVPPGWIWPRSWETGYPLIFIAQIDLATLPDNDVSRDLPGNGVLYFFHDPFEKEHDDDNYGCVSYDSNPTSDWIVATPPADIIWTGSDCHRAEMENGENISAFPKIEVVPVAVRDFPESPADVSDDLAFNYEYSERTEALPSYQRDSLWQKVASELIKKEYEALGVKRVGGWMGGYPSVFQNGMDFGTSIPPLMMCAPDAELEMEMGYLQYWFQNNWSQHWDGIYMNQEY